MLSPEQRLVRNLAREVASRKVAPRAAAWDREGAWPRQVLNDLAELGFLGMLTPERYGGLGLPLPAVVPALEELARADAALTLTVAIQNGPVPHVLLRHGTEAQRSRWLPALASGECLAGFALSEADAGSDPGSMTALARPDGDDWVLSGTKKWVTNGGRAELMLVFAKTGTGDRGRSRIGAFLVDTAAPGYRVGRREKTMGLRASETVEVHLEELRIGGDRLVGDPSRGLAYALEALDLGRIGIAAQAVGIATAALVHTTRHARERHQFGRPIARFGAIRGRMAAMAARIAAARALVAESALVWDTERGYAQEWEPQDREAARENPSVAAPSSPTGGQPPPHPGSHRVPSLAARAAMTKLVASETAMHVTEEAVRIFGGYGFMREYPVEKLMRDAKATEIYEGTSEILRMVIGRSLAP